MPAAYAALDQVAALWEVVLRDIRHKGMRIVPAHQTRDRYSIEVSLIRSVRLLNICRPADANLVVSGKRPPELKNAWPSAYAQTRSWMQQLYDSLPGIEGVLYESHQVESKCIVLFQLADQAIFKVLASPIPVRQDPIRTVLIEQAAGAGAVVDFEEVLDARGDDGQC